ncbi:MAG: hypothetical protein Q8K86_10730 [Candidatus Nanopelagicaceae bacterium]|nr:hypothetical protein [Candidatus Nanopelagicaceae bacterium]
MGLDLTLNDCPALLAEIDEIRKRHRLTAGSEAWIQSSLRTIQEWKDGCPDVEEEDISAAVAGLWSVADNERRRESRDARCRKGSPALTFQSPANPAAAERWTGLIREEIAESTKHVCSARIGLIAERLQNDGVSELEYEQMWCEIRDLNVSQTFYETYGLLVRPQKMPVPNGFFHRWIETCSQIDSALDDIKRGERPRKIVVRRVVPFFPVKIVKMERMDRGIVVTVAGKPGPVGLWLDGAASCPEHKPHSEPFAVKITSLEDSTLLAPTDATRVGVAAVTNGTRLGVMHVQSINTRKEGELEIEEYDYPGCCET